mmetsp:Transcript_106916/g.238590  ORF Transcript_106916/g.238590 Transcript_106916/m.238590 type:complete len:466 (+) Transcript_106916:98-1495(+)
MAPHITSLKAWSVGDIIAGITVAATSLPQYIAYAELAGLAGYRGVRCSGPPLVIFALLTGSPCLSIGVTSITALMASADLRGAEYKDAQGEEAWMDLLGAYSMLVGIASLVLAVSGAAGLASYIPGPVKAGWKFGFAFTVVCAQAAAAVFAAGPSEVKRRCTLPSLYPSGPPISGGAANLYRLGWVFMHPHLWDPAVVALAALTLAVVFRGKETLQRVLRLPGAEVIVATALGALVAISAGYSGEVVGKPPAAPPKAGGEDSGLAAALTSWVRLWPWEMPIAEVVERLGGWGWAVVSALAFAAVDFLAIISVEAERPPPGGWSPARELAGQGLGCLASGMAGSAPVGGSLSRSMVAGMTGASSPLMGLVSGFATLILAFPQVSALMAPTPKCVLAAIVLAAVLPPIIRPKDVLRLRGLDAAVGWTTAIASLMFDPTKGFGIGCAFYAVVQGMRHFRSVLRKRRTE